MFTAGSPFNRCVTRRRASSRIAIDPLGRSSVSWSLLRNDEGFVLIAGEAWMSQTSTVEARLYVAFGASKKCHIS